MLSRLTGYLRSFAIKFLKFLLSRMFVSLAIVVMVIFTIWWFGPRMSVAGYRPFADVNIRWLATTTVLVLALLHLFFVDWRRKRREQKEAETEKVEPVRDPIQERVDEFEQSFRHAMTTIRDNWTGVHGGRGKQSLYSLPWYVVMGFPAAGKSSLIVESEMKFPLAHLFSQEDAKHVKPTEDVDYWVTDDAVLFDLAGQVLTHSKARPEDEILDISAMIWYKFLNLVYEYRPRRPINGVVLCLDVVDLIKADPDKRANMAALIHARLVEMTEVLGTRYTVHVALTKIDLLDGFQDFVAGWQKASRQEPFGFSFNVYREADGDAWMKEFSEAYSAFLERLNNDMIDRIAEHRSTVDRRRYYTFTRQLAGLHDVLMEFMQRALHQDKFSTTPQIRGVYMLSNRQESAPFNALLQAASHKYEMRPPILPVHSGYSKTYFSTDFFKSVVFREAGLAGDNLSVERRKRSAFSLSVLAASLGAIFIGGLYWLAYKDNREKSEEVVAIAQNFGEIDTSNEVVLSKPAGAGYVEPLDSLQSASNVFGQYRNRTSVGAALTLYQGKKIGPEVEKAYVNMLDRGFLPNISNYVLARVNRLGEDPNTRASDSRLEALRVYLMLGDRDRRKVPLVEGWMGEEWQKLYEGNEEIQQGLKKHLNFAIETEKLQAPMDEVAVRRAQADLRRIPRDLRIYRNIEQLADRQLAAGVNLRNDIGPAYNIIFSPRSANIAAAGNQSATGQNQLEPIIIKPFFTKGKYHDFFVKQNDSLSKVAVEDAWVAGERDTVEYTDTDLENFRRKVMNRYATNYIDTWNGALNKLEIADFRSVDDGVNILEEITGPNDPFGRMLGRVKDETVIYEEKTVELETDQAVDSELKFDLNREQGLRIRRAFERLNQITEAEEGEKAYYEDLQAALKNLHEYLKSISQAGERGGEVALELAKKRMDLEGEDPIYVVERLAADLPEPLNRFFEKLAEQSWKVVLERAKLQLQRTWNDEIYTRYNDYFAPRYPFSPNAREEVALREFEGFFGPGGRVESFYKNNLVLFIDEATGEPRVIDGQRMEINRLFLTQLKKTLDLRNSYFDSDGALSVQYTLEPKSLSSSLSRASLNIEGQIISYSHGPRRPVLILWPNEVAKKAESTLTVFPSNNGVPRSLSQSGPWSGFRLIQRARLNNVTGDSADVNFRVGGARAVYTVRLAGQGNLFADQPLAGLSLPAEL